MTIKSNPEVQTIELVHKVPHITKYFPTPRSTKLRKMEVLTKHVFDVKSIDLKAASVAFEITDDEEHYEIITWNDLLYKPVNDISNNNESSQDIIEFLSRRLQVISEDYFGEPDIPFKEGTSKLFSDNFEEECSRLQEYLDQNYLIINGQLFSITEEPRYRVNSDFYLGSGWTSSVYIVFHFDEDTSRDAYYKATDYKAAFDDAIKNSDKKCYLQSLFDSKQRYIKVVDPKMVKLKLGKEDHINLLKDAKRVGIKISMYREAINELIFDFNTSESAISDMQNLSNYSLVNIDYDAVAPASRSAIRYKFVLPDGTRINCDYGHFWEQLEEVIKEINN